MLPPPRKASALRRHPRAGELTSRERWCRSALDFLVWSLSVLNAVAFSLAGSAMALYSFTSARVVNPGNSQSLSAAVSAAPALLAVHCYVAARTRPRIQG